MPASTPFPAAAVVVNDDLTHLDVFCELARKAGLEPKPFADAEAALAAMNPSAPPDLIVTGLHMPGLDGWRFCRLLRSPDYAAFNEVPILITSAAFAGEYPERIAADSGANAFLPSPVDGERFLAQVQALLQGKEMRRRPTVLIVEDDPDLAVLLWESFTAHGYQANTAPTAREAEEASARMAYDLAVLDDHLPDGNGDALLDAFARHSDCVCIIMTGGQKPALALDWMKRGAAACLHKPFAPELLIELCVRARRERALLRAEERLEARARALREDGERHRSLIEHSPDAIGIFQDERLVFANPATARMLGAKSAEELLGLSSAQLIHPEDRVAALDRVRRLMAGESGLYPAEVRYLRRDGSVVWGEVIGSLVQFAGQAAFQFVARDTTDRKRTEVALRLNEERLEALVTLNNMTDADEHELTHFAMEAAVRLTGSAIGYIAFMNDDETVMTMYAWSKQAMRECAVRDKPMVYPVASTGLWGEAVRQRKAVITNDYAAPNPWKKGTPEGHVHVTRHMNAPTFDGGKIVIVAGVGNKPTDYSDDDVRQLSLLMSGLWTIIGRKRAEHALRESEGRYKKLVTSANSVILRMDSAGRITFFNEFAQRLFGYTEDEVIGRSVIATIVPETDSSGRDLRSMIQSIVRQPDLYAQNENENMRRDGSRIWISWTNTPLLNAKGEILEILCIGHDITERKLMEDALQKRLVALTQPLDSTERIAFEDLFNLADLQRLQDEFAGATGVASIITRPDGTPITAPSNFCHLCVNIIRKTEKGLANCFKSDAALGRPCYAGPTIQPCLSGGLWDAGAAISVGGRHVANWLIGQVRDAEQTEEKMRIYAREIGADEDAVAAAFQAVPDMSRERFGKVAGMLFTLANQLSTTAYQNVQQARFIAGRKQAEEEKDKLQSQLTQAQKMESVGRLAGGVAHDFNNMLQVILGNTALVLEDLPPESPLRESLEEIQKSAQRSADLTRQLLAFARKQTIAPLALDLNATIEGMLKMLRRLIGEHIDLAWLPGADLGLVNMDPSQVDQLLANLCVNARDAIGGGVGKVTIKTQKAAFDEAYVAGHPEARAGEYVRLAVSDNGCGISPEAKAHLFEPFFTTKGVGQGTGLGLATVYGIVKQNHGFISVDSEPGHGTTFQIYLPRHSVRAVRPAGEASASAPSRGHETILLVEDEPAILRVSQRLLANLGYWVLAAQTPGEAMQLAREHGGEIHLLMTDVVMPEMNGRDLARNLLNQYPKLKRLFMSGYTADVIAHHGVLDPGVHFIQKPFSAQALADKVREVLEAHRGPPRSDPPREQGPAAVLGDT